jgi:hypothetical protein
MCELYKSDKELVKISGTKGTSRPKSMKKAQKKAVAIAYSMAKKK